jgi:hypothetical protein
MDPGDNGHPGADRAPGSELTWLARPAAWLLLAAVAIIVAIIVILMS